MCRLKFNVVKKIVNLTRLKDARHLQNRICLSNRIDYLTLRIEKLTVDEGVRPLP